MRYNVENEKLTIYFRGELNSSNSEETEKEIDGILSKTQFKSVVLDFAELTYISSAGLRIILKIKREHDDTKVVNVIDEVFDVFEMVGFNNFLTIEKKA